MVITDRITSRRTLLKTGIKLSLTPFIAGCDPIPLARQSIAPKLQENLVRIEPEKIRPPREGDVIILDNTSYVLNNGKRYPLFTTPEDFLENTKGKNHGVLIIKSGASQFSQLEIGEEGQGLIVDPYIAEGKINNKKGQIMDKFYAGVLTDGGDLYKDGIFPQSETFFVLQQALDEKGIAKLQRLHETFGVAAIDGNFAGYTPADTLVSPDISTVKAVNSLTVHRALFPYARFNLVGHSLGAYIAFWTAVAHKEVVNNLFLFSPPLLGIEKTWFHEKATDYLRKEMKDRGIEEHIFDYFYNLWGNTDYKNKVFEALLSLQKAGVVIHIYANKKDLVVPVGSSNIPGFTTLIGEDWSLSEIAQLLGSVATPDLLAGPIIEEHGRTRNDLKVVTKAVNLSRV